MNIRNIVPNPVLTIEPKAKVDGNSRLQNTGDRDGNGRQERPDQEPERKLNQQEFDEALKTLEAHPGLKASALVLKVEENDGRRFVSIVDPAGKVVRRMTESQLWAATRDKDRHTGKILDKAM